MKIPFLTPDIEQALEHFFKLTFLHNAYPIGLLLICIISLALAIHKPTRAKLLIFSSALLLLVHFEYLKHILEPLKAQTLLTVTTETPRYRFVWFVDKFLTKILPVGLLASGICAGILGVTQYFRERPRKEQKI
ncbi:hypothetical protein KBC70_04345 [Candidatus Woesebacteria bacterium]|nr:hypothetical protein [Candidatus Woesebacteria bacterium]